MLSQIVGTGFVGLLRRLLISPPPAEGFLLTNVVTPTVLVDESDAKFLGTPFTEGMLTGAGSDGLLFAQSSPISSGLHRITIFYGYAGTTGTSNRLLVRHRTVAGANVWTQIFNGGEWSRGIYQFVDTFSEGDDIRVEQETPNGYPAASSFQATVWVN